MYIAYDPRSPLNHALKYATHELHNHYNQTSSSKHKANRNQIAPQMAIIITIYQQPGEGREDMHTHVTA